MMDLTAAQWVRHAVTHPVEGFDDMRWKKSGSLKIAFFIVLAPIFLFIKLKENLRLLHISKIKKDA